MNLTEPQAGSRRRRAAHQRDAARRRQLDRSRAPRSSSRSAITTWPTISSTSSSRAPPTRRPGTRGISLFLVPKYRLDADGKPGESNDVRVVSIEHKMGLHASPDLRAELRRPRRLRRRADRRRTGRHPRDVHDDEQCAAQRRAAGRRRSPKRATQAAVAYARERIQSARAGSPSTRAGRDHRASRRPPHADADEGADPGGARAGLLCRRPGRPRARWARRARRRGSICSPRWPRRMAPISAAKSPSLGIQVHGGMGYIEETGAAQYFRDARITPIYEGTNGIQAADLVGRKLAMDNGGAAARALIADMRGEARGCRACRADRCLRSGRPRTCSPPMPTTGWPASYPFLTMLSVAVCGWLMERQGRVAARRRRSAFARDEGGGGALLCRADRARGDGAEGGGDGQCGRSVRDRRGSLGPMSFDLAAYLARIRLGARPTLDHYGLAAVQRAHRLAIPFENLDIRLGQGHRDR